jgi:ribokinase
MAAARHGAPTVMIGRLGDDLFAARLRERLASAGVGLDRVRTSEGGSGMSVAIQQDDGDYAAVVVSGANRDLDAAAVTDGADAIRDARVLVLQQEIADAANVAAARIARDAGATVILNAAPARPPGGLDGLVDVLVVNGVEAEMLGAPAFDDLPGAARAAADLLRSAPMVVVTAGGAGVASASRDGGRVTLPAHPVRRPETHGAGDVFVGALAARLADADAADAALRYANAAAALHVGTPEPARGALGPADVAGLLAATG